MKRHTRPLLYFIFTWLILSSCSDKHIEIRKEPPVAKEKLKRENERIGSEIKDRSLGSPFKSWEEEIQFVLEDRGEIRLKENGLELAGYHELEEDDSLINQILKEPFSSSSILPIVDIHSIRNRESLKAIKFSLFPVFETEQLKEANDMKAQAERKRIMIEHYRRISDLQVVRLDWRYNREKFSTYAVVTNKEIIYDDILTNLVVAISY